MRPFHRRNIFAILIMFVIGIAIYANSFQVPFIFDDTDNIQNPVIKIDKVSFNNVSEIFTDSLLNNRPVSNISFALNHYFGGERVQGYHLVNILIHIIAAIALYYLVFNTLSLANDNRIAKKHFAISFFTALLWLCHPLATQSVTYIVQRMNSMASMFYILSMLFYVLARKEQRNESHNNPDYFPSVFWFCLSMFAGLLAMGSKEIAATLPIAIFVYEWFFLQDLETSWIKRKIPFILITGLALIALAFIYTGGNLTGVIFSGYTVRDFTLEQRLLTELRVIVHYVVLLVFPSPDRLFLDYSFPISKSITQPISTFGSGIFLTLLAIGGCVFARKERLLSFCIFWFFINLFIESSFIPLEIVYEHRTYLPSMFAILFFVLVCFRTIPSRKVIGTLLLSLSVLFCYWTIQRNSVWGDPVVFWNKSLERFPDNARIHINIGVEYFKKSELTQAENHFRAALKTLPQSALSYNNLAEIKERKGDYHDAEFLLRKAIEITPSHVLARMNLASLLKKLGRFDESIEQYNFVHDLYPEFSVPNMEIGQLLLHANKPKEALVYLKKAWPRQSDNTSLIMAIAEANMRLGNTAESITYYEKASQLDPHLVTALFNLALLYNEIGNTEQAQAYYQKAYLIQPQFIPVTFNFGNFLLRNGNFSKAEEVYHKFLSQENMMADAHNNLGLTYLNMNMPQKALIHFDMALRINPKHSIAANNAKLVRETIERSEILKQ